MKTARMSVEPLLVQPACTVADAKEANDSPLHLVDEVASQERIREYCKMPHLSKNDAAIEWVAWSGVLGLLFTTIWLVCTL